MATDANTPQLLPVVTQTITGDHLPSTECSITDSIGKEAHFDKVGGLLGESLIAPFVQENVITKGSDIASETVLFHNPPSVKKLGPEETNTRLDFHVSDQAQKEYPEKLPLENEEIQGKKDKLKGVPHAELVRAECEEEGSRREVFPGEVKVVPIQQASDEEREEESKYKSTADEEINVMGEESSSSHKGSYFEAPEEAPSLVEEEKEDTHHRDEVVSSMTMETEPETTDHSHESAALSVVTQGESRERGMKVEPEEQPALTVVEEGAEEISPVNESTEYDEVEEEILFNGLRDKPSSLEASSQIPSRKEMIKEEAVGGVEEKEYDGSPALAEKETTSVGQSEVVHEKAHSSLFEECKTIDKSVVKVEEVPNMKEVGFQDAVPTQADDVIHKQDGQEEEEMEGLEEGGDDLKEIYVASTEVESEKTINPQLDIQSSEKEEDDMDVVASQAEQIWQGKSDQETVPLLSSEVEGEVISKDISERKDYENSCCLETSGEGKAIEKHKPTQDPQISMLEILQEDKAQVSEPVSLAKAPSFMLNTDVSGETESARTNEHMQAAELRKEEAESLPDTEETRQEILPSDIKDFPTPQASSDEHEEESKPIADEGLKAPEESSSSHSAQDIEAHKQGFEERSKEVEPVGQSAPTIQEGAEEVSSLKEGTKYYEVEEETGAGEVNQLKEGTKYNEVKEEIPSNDASDEYRLLEATPQVPISIEMLKEAGIVEEYDGPSTLADKQTTSTGQSVVVPEEDHSCEYEGKTVIKSTVKVEGEIPNLKEAGLQDPVPTQTEDSDKEDVEEEEEEKQKGLEQAGGDPTEIIFASSVMESEKTLDAKNEIQSSKKIDDDLAVACQAEQTCQGKSDQENVPLLSSEVEGEVIFKGISERKDYDNNRCLETSGEGKAIEKHEPPQQDPQISMFEISQEDKAQVSEPLSLAEGPSFVLKNDVSGETETARTNEHMQAAELRKEEVESLPDTEETRQEILPSEIKVYPSQQASIEEQEKSKSTADEELKAPEESSSSHSVQDFETHKEVLTLDEDKAEDTQGESEVKSKEVKPVGQSAPTIQEGAKEMSSLKEGTKYDEVEEEMGAGEMSLLKEGTKYNEEEEKEFLSNDVSDECRLLEGTSQIPISKEIIKEAGIVEECDGPSTLADKQTTSTGQSLVVPEEDHSSKYECKTMIISTGKVEGEIPNMKEAVFQDAVPTQTQTDDVSDKQDVEVEEKKKGWAVAGGDPTEINFASSVVESEKTIDTKNEIQSSKKIEDELAVACQAEQIGWGKSDSESFPLLSPEIEGEVISKDISEREELNNNCCVDPSEEGKAIERKRETPQQDSQISVLDIPKECKSDVPEPVPQAERHSSGLNNAVPETERTTEVIQEELRKEEAEILPDTEESRTEIFPSDVKVFPTPQASSDEHEEESKSTAGEELKAPEGSSSSHSFQDFETHKEVPTSAEDKKEDTQEESEERSKEVELVGQSAPTMLEGTEEMSPLKEGTKSDEVEEEIPSNEVIDESSLLKATSQNPSSKEIIKEAVEGNEEEYDGSSTLAEEQTTTFGQSVVVAEEDHSFSFADKCKTMIESVAKVEEEIPYVKEEGLQDAVLNQTDDVLDKQDAQEEEKTKGLDEDGGDPRETYLASSEVKSEETFNAKNGTKEEDDLAEQICQGKLDNESLPLLSPEVEGEIISKEISGEEKATEKHQTTQQDPGGESDAPEPGPQAESPSFGLNNDVTSETENARISEHIQAEEFRKEEVGSVPDTNDSTSNAHEKTLKDNLQEDAEMAAQLEHAEVASFVKEEGTVKQFEGTYEDHIQVDNAAETETDNKDITFKAPTLQVLAKDDLNEDRSTETAFQDKSSNDLSVSILSVDQTGENEVKQLEEAPVFVPDEKVPIKDDDSMTKMEHEEDTYVASRSSDLTIGEGEVDEEPEVLKVTARSRVAEAEAEVENEITDERKTEKIPELFNAAEIFESEKQMVENTDEKDTTPASDDEKQKNDYPETDTVLACKDEDKAQKGVHELETEAHTSGPAEEQYGKGELEAKIYTDEAKEESTTIEEEKQIDKETENVQPEFVPQSTTPSSDIVEQNRQIETSKQEENDHVKGLLVEATENKMTQDFTDDVEAKEHTEEKHEVLSIESSLHQNNPDNEGFDKTNNSSIEKHETSDNGKNDECLIFEEQQNNQESITDDASSVERHVASQDNTDEKKMHSLEESNEKFKEDVLLETDAKDINSQDDACEEKKMQMGDSTQLFKDSQCSPGGKEAEELLKEKIDNLSPQSSAVENEDMRSELSIPEYREHMKDGHESLTAEEYIQHGSIKVEPSSITKGNQESQENITDYKEMKMEDVPEESLQETIIFQDEDTKKKMMEVDIKRETQEGHTVVALPESSAENVVESFTGDEKEVTSSVVDEDEMAKASEDVAGDIGEVGALPKYEEQNEIVHKQEAREQSHEIMKEHKVVNETIQTHESSENSMEEDKTDHKLLDMSASNKSEEPPVEEINDSLTIDRKTIEDIPPEKHEDPADQSTDDKLEGLDQGLHSPTIMHEMVATGDDHSLASKHNPVEQNIIKEIPTSAIGEDQESQDIENEINEAATLTNSAEQNTQAEKEEATKQAKEILQDDTENVAIQSDESIEIYIDTEKQNVSEVPVSTKNQEPPVDKIIESFVNVEDTTNEIHQERDEKLVVESTKKNMDHENQGLNTSTVSNETNASTDINSLTAEQHPIDENTVHTVSSSIITEDKEAKDVANDIGEAATLTKCEEQNTLVQEEEATLVQAEHTEGILELHETEKAIIHNDESMKKLIEEKKTEHEMSQMSASEKSEESEVKEILECSKEKAMETPKEKHKDPAAESTEEKIDHEDQGSYSPTVIHELNEESLVEKLQPVDLNIITGVSSSVIYEIEDQGVVNENGELAALPKSEEQATKQSKENFQEDMTEYKTIQSDESIEILSKDIEKQNDSKVCMSAKTEEPPIESFVDDENGTKEILQELAMESTKHNVEHETQGVSTSTVEYETHGSGDNHTLTTEQNPTDENTIEALSSSMIAEVKESKDVAGDDSEAAAMTKCEEKNALVLTKATEKSEEIFKEHKTVSETIQNDESIETLMEEDTYKLSGISVLNKTEEPPIKGDDSEAAASTKCEEQNALVLREATEQSEEILKEHKTVCEAIQNDESIETVIEENSYKVSEISVLNKSENLPIKESTESSADDKMTTDKFSQEKHKDHEAKETEDKIEHEDQEKASSNTIYDTNATADDDSLEVKLHPVDVNITSEDSSPPVGMNTESQDVVNVIDETEAVTKSEEQITNVKKEETIKQTEEIPQKDQTENKTILIDESSEILIKDREEQNESEVTVSTKSEEPPVEEINESCADDENTTDKIPQEMYEKHGVESTNDNVGHEKQGLNTSTVIYETNSSKHSECLTSKQHPNDENIIEAVYSSMSAEEKEIKDVACDDSEAATSTKGEDHQNVESFETLIEDKEPPVKEIPKPSAEDRLTTEKTSHEMYKNHMEKGRQGHKPSSTICNLNATREGESLAENQHSVDVNIAKEISSSVMCEAKDSQDVVNEIVETEVVTNSEVQNTKAQKEVTEQTDEILEEDKTEYKTIQSHEIEDREEQKESKLYESTRSEEPTVEKINESFVDEEHSTKEIPREIHEKLAVESTKYNIEDEDRGMNTSTVTYETNESGYSLTLTPEQYPVDENTIEAASSSVIVEDKEVTDVACDDSEEAALTECEGKNTLVQKEDAILQSEEISKAHTTINETIQNNESIEKLIEDKRGHMESENPALNKSEKPHIQEIIESSADDYTITEKISKQKQKDLADEETEDKLEYEDRNNSSSIIHNINAAVDGESLAEEEHSVDVNIAKEVSSPVISEDKKSQHDVYEICLTDAMTKSEEENMKAQIEEATQQTEEILQEDRIEHKTIHGADNIKNLEEKEGHKVYVSTKSEEFHNKETTESSVDDEKATTEIPEERYEKLAVESTKANLEHENQTLKSATAEYNTTATGDRQSLTAEVHPVNVNKLEAISSSFIAEDDRENKEVANESGESSEHCEDISEKHKTVDKTIQVVERDNLVEEEISKLSASSKREESINATKSKETPDASLPCLNVTCDDMEKDKEIDETLTKDAPEHHDKDNVDLHYQEEEYEQQRTDEGSSEQIRTRHKEIHQDPQSGKEGTTRSCDEEANLKSDGIKDEIIEDGGSPEVQKQSDVKKQESGTIQNFDEQACEKGVVAGYHPAELTQNEASTKNSRSGEVKYEEKQEILHKAPESGCIDDQIEATTSKTFSADVPSPFQEGTSQLTKEDDLLTNKLIGMEVEASSSITVETEKLHEGEESTESVTDTQLKLKTTNKESEHQITCDSNDNVEMDPHVITERKLLEAENLEKLHEEIKQQHKSDGTSESVSEKENEITNRGSDNSSIDIVDQTLKEASTADETAVQKGALVTGINEQNDSVDNYDGSTNWAVEVEKNGAIQEENHSISSKEGASYTERDFASAYEVSSEPENKEEYENIQHIAGTPCDQNDPPQASNGEKGDVQEKTLKTFDSAFKENDHARDSQQTTGAENSKPTEKPSKETEASNANNMSEDGVPEKNADNTKCGSEVCETEDYSQYTMGQEGKEIEPVTKEIISQQDQQNEGPRMSVDLSLEKKDDEAKCRVCNIQSEDEGMSTNLKISSSPADLPSISDDAEKSSERPENLSANKVKEITRVVSKHDGDAEEGSKEIKELLMGENVEAAILESQAQTNKPGDEIITENESKAGNISTPNEPEEKPMPSKLPDEKEHKALIEIQKPEVMIMNRTGPTKDDIMYDSAYDVTKYENYLEEKGPEETEIQVGKEPKTSYKDEIASANNPILSSLPSQDRSKGNALEEKKQESTKKDEDDSDNSGIRSSLSTTQALLQEVHGTVTGDAIQESQQGEERASSQKDSSESDDYLQAENQWASQDSRKMVEKSTEQSFQKQNPGEIDPNERLADAAEEKALMPLPQELSAKSRNRTELEEWELITKKEVEHQGQEEKDDAINVTEVFPMQTDSTNTPMDELQQRSKEEKLQAPEPPQEADLSIEESHKETASELHNITLTRYEEAMVHSNQGSTSEGRWMSQDTRLNTQEYHEASEKPVSKEMNDKIKDEERSDSPHQTEMSVMDKQGAMFETPLSLSGEGKDSPTGKESNVIEEAPEVDQSEIITKTSNFPEKGNEVDSLNKETETQNQRNLIRESAYEDSIFTQAGIQRNQEDTTSLFLQERKEIPNQNTRKEQGADTQQKLLAEDKEIPQGKTRIMDVIFSQEPQQCDEHDQIKPQARNGIDMLDSEEIKESELLSKGTNEEIMQHNEVEDSSQEIQKGSFQEKQDKERSKELPKSMPVAAAVDSSLGTEQIPTTDRMIGKPIEEEISTEHKEGMKGSEMKEIESPKPDEEKEEEGGEPSIEDSTAPMIIEASKDVEVKSPHKKSHNILSGVGSKVKHSISKVKKAITGKSSHPKSTSSK